MANLYEVWKQKTFNAYRKAHTQEVKRNQMVPDEIDTRIYNYLFGRPDWGDIDISWASVKQALDRRHFQVHEEKTVEMPQENRVSDELKDYLKDDIQACLCVLKCLLEIGDYSQFLEIYEMRRQSEDIYETRPLKKLMQANNWGLENDIAKQNTMLVHAILGTYGDNSLPPPDIIQACCVHLRTHEQLVVCFRALYPDNRSGNMSTQTRLEWLIIFSLHFDKIASDNLYFTLKENHQIHLKLAQVEGIDGSQNIHNIRINIPKGEYEDYNEELVYVMQRFFEPTIDIPDIRQMDLLQPDIHQMDLLQTGQHSLYL